MALRYWLATLLWLGLVGAVQAGDALTKRREASQLIGGMIEVDAKGAVSGFTIEQRELLPQQVVQYLDRTIPTWRFEPVLADGQPVAARTDMSMRLVLKPLGEDQYALAVRGVAFGAKSAERGAHPAALELAPPRYPPGALAQGLTADVYLLVKVGRDGKVEDAIDEQVNLTTSADPRKADRVRRMFARAAIDGAMRWDFAPPTTGDALDAPFWTVRVPVIFDLVFDAPTVRGPGEWRVYEPGPRRDAPWEQAGQNPNFSPDALPPGGAYAVGDSLRMLPMAAAP